MSIMKSLHLLMKEWYLENVLRTLGKTFATLSYLRWFISEYQTPSLKPFKHIDGDTVISVLTK